MLYACENVFQRNENVDFLDMGQNSSQPKRFPFLFIAHNFNEFFVLVLESKFFQLTSMVSEEWYHWREFHINLLPFSSWWGFK